jgi:hypothetical protein
MFGLSRIGKVSNPYPGLPFLVIGGFEAGSDGTSTFTWHCHIRFCPLPS